MKDLETQSIAASTAEPLINLGDPAVRSSTAAIKAFVTVVVLATVLTWVLGLVDIGSDERRPVAFNSAFPGDLDAWGRKGDWEAVEFSEEGIFIQRRSDKQSSAFNKFSFPRIENVSQYRLEVEGVIKTRTIELETEVPVGAKPMGVLMVWMHDSTGEIIRYRTIHDLDPALEENLAHRSIAIPPEATDFSIALSTRESNAGYLLTNVRADLVHASSAGRYVQIGLLILWGVILLVAAYWIFRKTSILFSMTVLLVLVAIFIGIIIPESISSKYLLPLHMKLPSLSLPGGLGTSNSTIMEAIFKTGHFFFFLIAAFILFLRRKTLGLNGFLLFILLLSLAIATEGIQLQLYDRTTRLSDLLIDLSGVITGVALAGLINFLLPKKTPDASDNAVTSSAPKNSDTPAVHVKTAE